MRKKSRQYIFTGTIFHKQQQKSTKIVKNVRNLDIDIFLFQLTKKSIGFRNVSLIFFPPLRLAKFNHQII